MTRDLTSVAAKRIEDLGAEMIKADLSDKDSLKRAMQGCYGVFGVTNFWEHFDKEVEHGKNLIDAVKESNIKHLVLSTQPSPKKITGEKIDIPHFETKAQIEDYSRSKNIPATYIQPAFYFENFLSYFPPMKGEDGSYSFGFPQGDTPLAALSIEDLGGIVNTIFNNPNEYIGKVIGGVSEDLKPAKYAEIMTNILGKSINYNFIPSEVFASFGFPGAEDLANMFTFNRLYILNRKREQKESKEMYPYLKGFEQWLGENKEKFNQFF